MAQLVFEKIINLTEDSSNPDPKLVERLMIGEEADEGIYQYYMSGGLLRDKKGAVALADYDNLGWQNPTASMTSQSVSNFGIKTFPHIGAYGFYTPLGSETSKLLLPIHLKQRPKYAAPTMTVVDNGDSYTFTFVQPEDITYECFRLVLELGSFAAEYVTYDDSITVPKSDFYGTRTAYCYGYVDEGQATSENSEVATVTGTAEEYKQHYYTSDEIELLVNSKIAEALGTVGIALDAINGEVI